MSKWKRCLLTTALSAGALFLGSLPAKAIVTGPSILAYDCTTMSGTNCAGSYPTFQEIMGRVDHNVVTALCGNYPDACSDFFVLYLAGYSGDPHPVDTSRWSIKIVSTDIKRNGVSVGSYHAQYAGSSVPYAVVTTLNKTAFQVAQAVSNQIDQMILDPHLNNSNGEVCPGSQSPSAYTASTPVSWWPWQENIPDGPVCNFEINPGTGTYCSTHPSDPGC